MVRADRLDEENLDECDSRRATTVEEREYVVFVKKGGVLVEPLRTLVTDALDERVRPNIQHRITTAA